MCQKLAKIRIRRQIHGVYTFPVLQCTCGRKAMHGITLFMNTSYVQCISYSVWPFSFSKGGAHWHPLACKMLCSIHQRLKIYRIFLFNLEIYFCTALYRAYQIKSHYSSGMNYKRNNDKTKACAMTRKMYIVI